MIRSLPLPVGEVCRKCYLQACSSLAKGNLMRTRCTCGVRKVVTGFFLSLLQNECSAGSIREFELPTKLPGLRHCRAARRRPSLRFRAVVRSLYRPTICQFMLLPDEPASEERLEKRVLFSVKAGDLTMFGKSHCQPGGKDVSNCDRNEQFSRSFVSERSAHSLDYGNPCPVERRASQGRKM